MKKRSQIFFPRPQIFWGIFLTFLIVRVGFVVFSGYNSFQLLPDTERYDRQSNEILAGHFNLTEPLFITAPIYPYLEALFKFLFGLYWILALQIAQILISSLSGVYLYKTAQLIWGKEDIALTASAIYCFFPFTLWWVHTFSQEMLFQSFLIFTVYSFLKSIYKNDLLSLLVSAALFSVTFLTKSHILLFALFIPIIIFLLQNKNLKQSLGYTAVFTAVCFIFTIPYGLYNLKVNGQYVISSTGLGAQFLLGHNDDAYLTIVNPPPYNSAEAVRLSKGDFLIFRQLADEKQGLSQSQLEKLYFNEGLRWCQENPQKAVTIALYDLYYFLMPGLNKNWYSQNQWLASIIISSPIYIFGYIGIFLSLKRDFKRHFWILALFISMIIFSVGLYVQNRFRTITLEPFYILYAAFCVSHLMNCIFHGHREDIIKFENIDG
jgi:hypothetical protein